MKDTRSLHPLMLAAAIAFWGWQAGQWLAAVVAGSLLCASFYVPLHWTFSAARQYRVADFCTVLALLLGAYFYLVFGNPRAIIQFFEWLPLMLLPVALMHAYGHPPQSDPHMDVAVLFWSARRLASHDSRPALFDPWWPYYALWIIAAAAANQRGEAFYLALIALASWPLVRVRPWSYRVGTWGVAFSLAAGLGYGLHHGLSTTQAWLEGAVPEWINASGSRTDPYRATTDIGHIGKLKESDAIVLRVTTPDGKAPPQLLHRASYNVYFSGQWLARGGEFSPVTGSAERWPLAATTTLENSSRLTVHDYSARPNPVLSLPTGTSIIEPLSAIELRQNPLGAVQIMREPGYFSYGVVFTGDAALEGPATGADGVVPPKEREAYTALATELGLSPQRSDESLEAVKQHFVQGYRYSTYQKDALFTGSPMVDFLHRSKSGHCEYFATATVLLLRAGGIPARYATGFAVVERSDREQAWVVRTRHAHAWVRAYVNGAWIDIDTTPSSWLDVETQTSGGVWSALSDGWSWLHFRASQAWAKADGQRLLTGALIFALPFAFWLAVRLWRNRRRTENIEQNQLLTKASLPGADSAFYRVEARMAQQGHGRMAHETTRDWLTRLRVESGANTEHLAELESMAGLHNRYRFDPAGISDEQRLQLEESARKWLVSEIPAVNALTASAR